MFGKNLTIAVAATATLGAPAFAVERLSMATPWPSGGWIESMERMAENVNALSGGELEIEVLVGGAIGSPLKVTEAVEKGLAQAGHNWPGYDWGIDTASVLFSGFAGSPEADVMMAWLTWGGGDELLAEFRLEEFGVVSIPCGLTPAEVGMVSTKRIQTLEDLQGVKMRTSGAWAEIGGQLGMSTVSMAGSEIYPALERGVIDALEWGGLDANMDMGFEEIAKYAIFPGLHQPVAVTECLFNPDVWEGLSENHREVLKTAALIELRNTYEKASHDNAEAYPKYVEAGVEFVVLDDEVIEKAREATAAWADKHAEENEWFKRVLESQRAYAKNWENKDIYQ